jgi:predicted TIM-barrel fold metal-dependent hydrolase
VPFVPSDEVRRIKAGLDHPVIDSDGHAIEYLPLVRDILEEQAGAEAAAALDRTTGSAAAMRGLGPEQMRGAGMVRISWWGLPARNTLDRATALLPALLAERIEEMGIDHAVLYPTYGLGSAQQDDADLRRAIVRAFNTFYSEAFREHTTRLTPVGIIPMHTPEEAIAELDFATSQLGLKAFMFGGPISRPIPGLDAPTRVARWLDTLGVDSVYDYDPVWAKCVELGVSPTFHTASMGWPTHSSVSSYVYNHIGMFATAGETLARSLFLGGVPHRFPSLRFAFQEGGVAWAASLYSSLVSHWEKRNRDAISHYDPATLDRALIRQMFERYGSDAYRSRLDALDDGLRPLSLPDEDPSTLDEFARSGVEKVEDIRDLYTTAFHFGCEADDPMTALAFDAQRNPLGARLRAVFASDVGHWDVPDVREVLPEAWELVEDGHATVADFRALTFENAVSLWASGNPYFFAGTTVADAVAEELGTTPRAAARN